MCNLFRFVRGKITLEISEIAVKYDTLHIKGLKSIL